MVVSQQETVLRFKAHLRLAVVAVLFWLSLPAATREPPAAAPASAASAQTLSAPVASDTTKSSQESQEAVRGRKSGAPSGPVFPPRGAAGRQPAAAGLCDGS